VNFTKYYDNLVYHQEEDTITIVLVGDPPPKVVDYLKKYKFKKWRHGEGYRKRLTNTSLLEASRIKWLLR
jgi:hypothetical protein